MMTPNTARDIAIIRRRLDSLPRIKPSQDSYVQDFLDSTTVAAPLTPTTPLVWVTARTIDVPPQKRAVVKYFAYEGDRPAALFFTRFRFVVNGAGGTNYQSPPIAFASIQNPTEIWIDADQQNTIELQFKNFDQTIGYLIFSRVVCWSWDLLMVEGRI